MLALTMQFSKHERQPPTPTTKPPPKTTRRRGMAGQDRPQTTRRNKNPLHPAPLREEGGPVSSGPNSVPGPTSHPRPASLNPHPEQGWRAVLTTGTDQRNRIASAPQPMSRPTRRTLACGGGPHSHQTARVTRIQLGGGAP